MGRKRLSNLDLPQHVYCDHGTYYYRKYRGRRIRLGSTPEDARAAMERMGHSPALMHTGHLAVIYWHARKNAKTRELAFDLTREDLQAIWLRSGGRCELTGLPFDLSNSQGFRRRPYAPSIDRIVGSAGYSLGNCRLILAALNMAINEWGDEVFRRIALAYLRKAPQNFPHG